MPTYTPSPGGQQRNAAGRPTVAGKGIAQSAGRGIGSKGIGLGGGKTRWKRQKKLLKDNVHGITKPDIRRLARRGGVKRISGMIYEETRAVLKAHLEKILADCVAYCEHARRKTVTVTDVIFALRRLGRPIYGFDPETYDAKKKTALAAPRRGARY